MAGPPDRSWRRGAGLTSSPSVPRGSGQLRVRSIACTNWDVRRVQRAHPDISDSIILEHELREADVVIGAVLVPGAVAPHLVTREMLALMKTPSE